MKNRQQRAVLRSKRVKHPKKQRNPLLKPQNRKPRRVKQRLRPKKRRNQHSKSLLLVDLSQLVLKPGDVLSLGLPVQFNQIGTFDYTGLLKGTSDVERKYALPELSMERTSFVVNKPQLSLVSVPDLDFGQNKIQSQEMDLSTSASQVIQGVDEHPIIKNWQLSVKATDLQNLAGEKLDS